MTTELLCPKIGRIPRHNLVNSLIGMSVKSHRGILKFVKWTVAISDRPGPKSNIDMFSFYWLKTKVIYNKGRHWKPCLNNCIHRCFYWVMHFLYINLKTTNSRKLVYTLFSSLNSWHLIDICWLHFNRFY